MAAGQRDAGVFGDQTFLLPWVRCCWSRGLLELDAAVQRYWPRFQARADVAQVLSHQTGVVVLEVPAPTEVFYDWDRLCALLAGQAPVWEPGTCHGESVLFYGHLLGELVRRVDGRTPGQFLREEICGPLGLHVSSAAGATRSVAAVNSTPQPAHGPEALCSGDRSRRWTGPSGGRVADLLDQWPAQVSW